MSLRGGMVSNKPKKLNKSGQKEYQGKYYTKCPVCGYHFLGKKCYSKECKKAAS